MTKADQTAGERVLKAACRRATEILREPVGGWAPARAVNRMWPTEASGAWLDTRNPTPDTRRARAAEVLLHAGRAVEVLWGEDR